MTKFGLALAALLTNFACDRHPPDGVAPPGLTVGLPEGVFVLPGALVPDLLKQCSRETPPPGEATWMPGAADIARLEAALGPALARRPEAVRTDFSKVPAGWWRQYAGIVRDGRRFIYGNFFHAPDPRYPGPRKPDYGREVAVICDGGPFFFGVEYDVEAGRFTHFGFNGMA